MRKLLTVLVFLVCNHAGWAQQEYGAFNITGSGLASTLSSDYQCIGINPANLGLVPERRIHLGFMETGVNFYSAAFSRVQAQSLLNDYITGNDKDFTESQKRAFAQDFTDAGTEMNLSSNLFGAALQLPGFGGLAIGARLNVVGSMKLNKVMSDIIFNGYDADYFDSLFTNSNGDTIGVSKSPQYISVLTDGSYVRLNSVLELSAAYGRKVYGNDNFKLYAGVGFKYLMGVGNIDVSSTDGTFTAYTSFSPALRINYDKVNPSGDKSGALKPAGTGYGVDFGLTVEYREKWQFSAAINNVGQMTWNANVFELTDGYLDSLKSEGVNNFRLLTQTSDLLKSSGTLGWDGRNPRSASLPANIRFGAKYQIKNILNIGFDVFSPINAVAGNMEAGIVTLGAEVTILKTVKLSGAVAYGGISQFNVPLGIVFAPVKGAYEFGVASRDLFTFFTNNNPNLSAVMGFARFGIL